jgi:hypothetical protein
VWVSRVRRKLGAKPGEPGPITTFQGIGYVLNVDDEPALAAPSSPSLEGPVVAASAAASRAD